MATKSRTRINTAKSSQSGKFKFRWWMALILVIAVAAIGIVILRFSHASRAYTNAYPDTVTGFTSIAGGITVLHLRSSGNWVRSNDVPYTRWFPNTHVKQTCADIVASDAKRPFAVGTQVEVREFAPTGGDITYCP